MRSATVFLSGYFGAENFGDELGLRVLIQQAENRGLGVVFASNAASNEVTGLMNAKSIKTRSVKARFQTIRDAEFVVVGPGGILKSPRGSGWAGLATTGLLDTLIANVTRTPVSAISISSAGEYGRVEQKLLQVAFGRSPLFVRDPRSAHVLRALGLCARESADLIFATDLTKPLQSTVNSRSAIERVVISPSASDFRNSGSSPRQVAKEIAKFVVREFGNLPIAILACQPQDLSVRAWLEAAGLSIAEEIDWTGGETDRVGVDLGPRDFLLAQRFHAALGGALSGAAVVSFGADPKLKDLEEMLPGAINFVDFRPGAMVSATSYQKLVDRKRPLELRNRIETDLQIIFDRTAGTGRKPSVGRTLLSGVVIFGAGAVRAPLLVKTKLRRVLRGGYER